MANVGFTGDGFLVLADRLRTLAASFATSLGEVNTVPVEAEMRSEVNLLYGPKLGAHWIIEHGAVSGAIASVTVRTDSEKVRGYEFGTRAHRIPRDGYARPVLHFDGKYGPMFLPYVQHPGTKAHNKSPELKEALRRSAESAWSQALQNAFQNF